MNRLLRISLLFAAFLPWTRVCSAQLQVGNQQGILPYGSYHGGTVDSVNLQNGNLTVSIPLFSLPQTGKLALSYSLTLNNQGFTQTQICDDIPANPQCYPQYIRSGPIGPNLVMDQALNINETFYPDPGSDCSTGNEGSTCQNEIIPAPRVSVIDGTGASHELLYDSANWALMHAVDGSGYSFQTGYTASNFQFWYGPAIDPNLHCTYPTYGGAGLGAIYTASGISHNYEDTCIQNFTDPVTFQLGTPSYPTAMRDPSGNTITYSIWTVSDGSTAPGAVTDTAGRKIPDFFQLGYDAIVSARCPNLGIANEAVNYSKTWVVPGPNGGQATYTFCYANVSYNTDFGGGVLGYSEMASGELYNYQAMGGAETIQSVVLPNGTYWGFVYDTTGPFQTENLNGEQIPDPTTTPVAYANLTKLIFPTGGSISYAYNQNVGCTSTAGINDFVRTRTLNDNNGNSSPWTYTFVGTTGVTINSNGTASPISSITTVTDPNQNDTVHTFSNPEDPDYACTFMHEGTTQEFLGSSSQNQTLQTTSRSFANTALAVDSGTRFTYNAEPTSSTASITAGTSTSSTITYPTLTTLVRPQCSFFQDAPQPANCQGSLTGMSPISILFNQPSVISASGSDGSFATTTTTSYEYQAKSAYLAANLLSLVSSVQVANNQTNTVASQTSYGFDESNGSPQGTFGNQTSVTQMVNTGGQTQTSTVYNTSGMPTSTKDANLNQTTRSYQCSGALPYQITNALGQVTTYGYDCNTGNLTSVQDPNDLAAQRAGTTYGYAATGDLSKISYPDGGSVSVNYNNYSLPLTISTTTAENASASVIRTTVYDGFVRAIHTELNSDPAGADIIDTTYDNMGRVQSVSNPHRSSASSTDGTTTFSYDALGRKTLQTQQDKATQKWSYSGNVTTFTDEVSHSWQRTADALGRLTKVVEPSGAQTGYVYDALSNLVTVNQNGVSGETPRTRSFSYDSLSRLLSAANPETGTIGYGYDANGNVTSKTDARGITTSYTYDALNRLTNKSSAGGNGVPGFNYLYGYDSISDGSEQNGIGRLLFTTTSPGVLGGVVEQYFYDSMGRITSQITHLPSAPTTAVTTSATYDLAGNVTSLTYPDGRVVSQQWDGGGHLTQVADAGGQYLTPSTAYWPNGIASMWYGNGVANGVNLNNRLQANEIGPVRLGSVAPGGYPGNNSLSGKEYCYGPATSALSSTIPGCPALGSANNGNIWQVTDLLNSAHTENFGYDNLNRLTSFSRADGSMSQTYAYDSFGNLNQTSPGTLQNKVSFDANNRINSGSYGYDNAGNVTSSFNGISTAYSYDAENRLTSLNNGAATYTYDADGGRSRKDNGTNWTEYVRFGGQVMAEHSSDGFWSDYIFANGQRIARADNYDIRIHMSGTNCSGCGITNTFAGTTALTGVVGGTMIQDGDLLTWRQYQDGVAAGGISLAFNNDTLGTTGNLNAVDGQPTDDDSRTGQWYQRVADLSSYAGDTVSSLNLHNYQGGAAGNWDIYLADISLVHPDGTSVPIYYRTMESLAQFNPGGAESNVSVVTEKVPTTPNPYITTYYSVDQIGSSILLTDSAGWPVSSDTYYPFGQEPNPPSDGNHYKFTGKERDTESGLDNFGARYYESSMGRFMSPDPSGLFLANPYNPQSLNLYSYVLNNPLVNVDPTGLDCVTDNGDGTASINSGDCPGNNPNNEYYYDCGSTDGCLMGTTSAALSSTGILSLYNGSSNTLSTISGYGGGQTSQFGNPWGNALFAQNGVGAQYFTGANTAVNYAAAGYATLAGGAFFAPEIAAAGGAAASWTANSTGMLGPAAGRVFWSAIGSGAAAEWAEENGGTTLEMTPFGGFANWAQGYLPQNAATGAVWNALSSGFEPRTRRPPWQWQGTPDRLAGRDS